MIECNSTKVRIPGRNEDIMRLIALGDDRQQLRQGSTIAVDTIQL